MLGRAVYLGDFRVCPRASARNQFSLEFAWLSCRSEFRFSATHEHHGNLRIIVSSRGVQCLALVGERIKQTNTSQTDRLYSRCNGNSLDRFMAFTSAGAAAASASFLSHLAPQFPGRRTVTRALVPGS